MPPALVQGKRPRGRPKKVAGGGGKFNQRTVDVLLKAKRLGAKDLIACQAADITLQTLRNWRDRGEEARERRLLGQTISEADIAFATFVEMYENATSEAAVKALETINKAAKSGDVKAAQWLLERQFGYGAVNTTRVLGSGADGSIQVVHHVEPLPETRAREILTVTRLALPEGGR